MESSLRSMANKSSNRGERHKTPAPRSFFLSVREEEEYSKTEGAVVGCCRCWSGLCYCRLQLIAFSPAAPLLLDAGWLIVTSMRLLPNVRCWPLSHPSRESRWKTIAIAGYFTDGWLD